MKAVMVKDKFNYPPVSDSKELWNDLEHTESEHTDLSGISYSRNIFCFVLKNLRIKQILQVKLFRKKDKLLYPVDTSSV
jgi:hypothetical protein